LKIDAEQVRMLKDHYKCQHFRILVIGRANAGKTTILEKVCGVAQGTKPIIYDQKGVELNFEPKKKLFSKVKYLLGGKTVAGPSDTRLRPSIEVS
jgi:hypothetical protein